jgi:FRG domain-containing protein
VSPAAILFSETATRGRSKDGPVRSYYEFEVDTLEEALEYLSTSQALNKNIVFRGQANAEWALTSNAFRGGPQQDIINKRFRKTEYFCHWWRTQPHQYNHFDDEQIWQVAQHYGMHTDLLDFTRSLDIAAFFACEEMRNEPPTHRRAALFAIEPSTFELIAQLKTLPVALREKAGRYKKIWWPNKIAGLSRMEAQQGCFIMDPDGSLEGIVDGRYSLIPLAIEVEFDVPLYLRKVSFNRRPTDIEVLKRIQHLTPDTIYPPPNDMEKVIRKFEQDFNLTAS